MSEQVAPEPESQPAGQQGLTVSALGYGSRGISMAYGPSNVDGASQPASAPTTSASPSSIPPRSTAGTAPFVTSSFRFGQRVAPATVDAVRATGIV